MSIRKSMAEGSLSSVLSATWSRYGPIFSAMAQTKTHDKPEDLAALLLGEELYTAIVRCAERTNLSRYSQELRIIVDRQAAQYSAWYEMVPRSQSGRLDRAGTFDDVIARLPY